MISLRKTLFALFAAFLLFGAPLAIHAFEKDLIVNASLPAPRSLVENISDCIATGNCTICDGVKFLATIAQWLLATIGGMALFFLIFGGFDLLTSGGASEKVEAGKKKITNSVIGLAIVVGAWTLINIVIGLVVLPTNVTPSSSGAARLFKSPSAWSQIQCE